MERRTVRIYKAPHGQGEYINKTKKFLQKAQMGAETSTENVMKEKQFEALRQYVTGALDNEMEPEEIYKLLVSKGIPKEIAYPILTQAMQEREAPEEEQPATEGSTEESKIGQSEYQPVGEENQETEEEDATSDGMNYYNSYADEEEPDVIANSEEEYQDGGPITSYDQLTEDNSEDDDLETRLTALTDFVKNSSDEADDFKDFGKDITEYEDNYTPIEWDVLGDGYGYYKKGGSKKNFTKNVLALIKKQEGGDAEESKTIGQGNKKDTITNDVSKIKSQFTNKLKEISSKAAIDSIYDKMMQSNNPELMQQAQELAQNRKKASQMGSFEPIAQQGGYAGENQPEMFSQGGFDMPQAQKGGLQKFGDFLLGEKYTVANNPYNAKTGALYKDPLTGLTPVARTVHKRGIFGRPKKYTDYYSKDASKFNPNAIPGNEVQGNEVKSKTKDKKENETNKWGFTEKEWDEFSGKEKRLERRGQRRLNRQLERGEKLTAKDKEFMSTPNLIQQFDGYTEQINDANGNRLKVPKLLQVTGELEPELPFEERMGMNDPEFYRTESKEIPLKLIDNWSDEDEAILDERRAEADAIYQQALKEREEELQKEKAEEAERRLKASRFYANYPEGNTDRRLGLGDATDPDAAYPAKARDRAYNQFATARDFRPDLKKFFQEPEALKRAREEEQLRNEQQEELQSQEYEKRYGGGLGRYQIAGAVKSPTNKLSTASDPTAMIPGTGPLMPTAKPKPTEWHAPMIAPEDDNSALPDILDPDKFKETILNTKDTQGEDDLIAQDVQTKRRFNGVNFDTKLNMGLDAFTGAMNSLNQNKQQAEMYRNNFTSDNLYGASTDKDRGDYVAYGQQTGMFRPDETGQETSGRFAYGQSGGYMQSGGYTEGDEVDMTPEELEAFLANGGEVEYL